MKTALLCLALVAGAADAQQYDRDDRGRRDDGYRGDDLQLVCYGQAERPWPRTAPATSGIRTATSTSRNRK